MNGPLNTKPTNLYILEKIVNSWPQWLSWMHVWLMIRQLFSWRLIMKYFLGSFSPFCWFKTSSCQFLSDVARCHVSYVTGASNMLAYSWARLAILVAGKGRGRMFIFPLFLHFHSCFFPVPLFHLLYYLFYLFSPFLWETTQNDPQGLKCR